MGICLSRKTNTSQAGDPHADSADRVAGNTSSRDNGFHHINNPPNSDAEAIANEGNGPENGHDDMALVGLNTPPEAGNADSVATPGPEATPRTGRHVPQSPQSRKSFFTVAIATVALTQMAAAPFSKQQQHPIQKLCDLAIQYRDLQHELVETARRNLARSSDLTEETLDQFLKDKLLCEDYKGYKRAIKKIDRKLQSLTGKINVKTPAASQTNSEVDLLTRFAGGIQAMRELSAGQTVGSEVCLLNFLSISSRWTSHHP